jgi:hypothetical protein
MKHGARRGPNEGESDDWYEKVMLTMVWGIDGFHVVNMMQPGRRFNIEDFRTHSMDPFLVKIGPEGRKSYALRLSAQLNNCRVHDSNASKQFLMKILSFLFLIRHTVLSWRHPTSNFSVTSRHVLQVGYCRVFTDVDELPEAVIVF